MDPHARMLKLAAYCVLASLRGSTTKGVRLTSSLTAALRDEQFEHCGSPELSWWIPNGL